MAPLSLSAPRGLHCRRCLVGGWIPAEQISVATVNVPCAETTFEGRYGYYRDSYRGI
ncbi:hypothetical protein I79_019228 [Cricetulus griseus]|uniref:Uncharacterized protein n=1 Tax=Cricetulus griseus TaxID=10029 RepID=G3I6V0_CRIGR|nr:hypothetical protein I79_019228 [Cricetulus griseus]